MKLLHSVRHFAVDIAHAPSNTGYGVSDTALQATPGARSGGHAAVYQVDRFGVN